MGKFQKVRLKLVDLIFSASLYAKADTVGFWHEKNPDPDRAESL